MRGGDKVSRDELRATLHTENLTGKIINRAWNGTTITLSAAHNEVVSFNLVLEAASASASNVSVSFDTLTGPNGATIHSSPASGNEVFSWVNRPIELFYERYLQIKGLSFFGYWKGNEHIFPKRFQLPSTADGRGIGSWTNRPDHDKFYPDILVPLELVPTFNIQAGQNQSVWSDIYVPKTAPAGTYTGTVTVREGSEISYTVPVQLTVYNFTLPDVPSAQVMMPFNVNDIMWRYATGYGGYANPLSADGQRILKISDRYFELFHRHKIALLGDNDCAATDSPCPSSVPRYTGSLFSAANGYDGPGVNTPVGIYAVGLFANWSWRFGGGESAMWQHSDNWINWFNQNAPGNKAFLYLEDEPPLQDLPQVETWSRWLNENPGPGHNLASMSTLDMVGAHILTPSLSIPATHAGIGSCPLIPFCDSTAITQSAADYYSQTAGKQLWMYNDGRPGAGTLNTEDEGTAVRQMPWAQYKKGVQRWFYWSSNLTGTMNLFQSAVTWGSYQFYDSFLGWYGNDGTTNGNGVLVYPGTDVGNRSDSYGFDGPFASLRLKEWRRGIQDVDYLTLAAQIDPAAVKQIVSTVVPKVLWEYPSPGGDPSYYLGDLSWSADPDVWENARAQLAAIISGSGPTATTPAPATVTPDPSTIDPATVTPDPTPVVTKPVTLTENPIVPTRRYGRSKT